MIKNLIKHIIAEYTIDAFFQNITKNFNKPQIEKFYVGQKFNIIVLEWPHVNLMYKICYIRTTIYNATVTDLYEKNFRIKTDRPLLRENLSDGISQYINLASGYHTVFYDDIKYIE